MRRLSPLLGTVVRAIRYWSRRQAIARRRQGAMAAAAPPPPPPGIVVASSIASRVLPIPPGPVSVSTRRSRARRSSAASASSASSARAVTAASGSCSDAARTRQASRAVDAPARCRGVAAEATSPPLEQRQPRGEAPQLPLVTPLLELAAANQPPLVRRALAQIRDGLGLIARQQARVDLFGELLADDPALVAHPEHGRGQEHRDET